MPCNLYVGCVTRVKRLQHQHKINFNAKFAGGACSMCHAPAQPLFGFVAVRQTGRGKGRKAAWSDSDYDSR